VTFREQSSQSFPLRIQQLFAYFHTSQILRVSTELQSLYLLQMLLHNGRLAQTLVTIKVATVDRLNSD